MEKLFATDFEPERMEERKRAIAGIASNFGIDSLSSNDAGSISAVRYRVAEYGARGSVSDREHTNAPHEVHLPKETGTGGLSGTYTIDQAIDFIGFGNFQMKLSLLAGLAWMADAMEMMILSILGPELHCVWGLSSWEQALITTVVFCGMMCSSTLWGHACDRYGRKYVLIISSMITFYFGFLSSFAPNFYWMCALRGAVGWGIGGAPQSVTLYSEFLPGSVRAKCLIYIEVFWAIGAAFEVLLALVVMPTLGWRWLLVFSSLPLLLFGILAFWMPESARYYVGKGQQDKAMAILQRIAKSNGKVLPPGQLVLESVKSVDGIVVAAPAMNPSLLSKELRKTTLLLWWIFLANAFSYYGIVLMSTELIQVGDTCRVPGFTHNLEAPCGLECRRLSESDYMDLLWSTFAEFPGLVITALIVDRLGRKRTMFTEFGMFSIATFLLMICTGRRVMILLLFLARCFISGAFQAAYVYTPEVYPTSIRAVGLGTCSAMARIGAILTPFIAQVVVKYSVYIAVITYGTVCLFGAIASLLLPIETAGRSMGSALIPH